MMPEDEEKLRLLRDDFLDRDQGSYVHIRRHNRSGWESLIPEGGNYSDIFRSHTQRDVIKDAYRLAKEYIVAMDTPYRVNVTLSPGMNCTDSKTVCLATKVFDDPDMTEGQKVDTFLGLAIHEGCHLKYTDFSIKAAASNEVIASLVNLIEDERIERLCGEQMPGYANYLKPTKYYMFDKYCQDQSDDMMGDPLPQSLRLMNSIIALLRYPKCLREDDVKEFLDPLYQVRELMKDFPTDRNQVLPLAEGIYDVIRGFFEKQENERKQDCSKKGQGEDGKESGRQGSGNEQTRKEEPEEKQQSGTSPEQAMREIVQQARNLQKLSPQPGTESVDREDMADEVRKDGGLLAKICEGIAEETPNGETALYHEEGDKQDYLNSLFRVQKYIPAIRKALLGHTMEHRDTLRGLRNGLLDTVKIAEAFQGVSTVYKRETLSKTDNLTVTILIDESGSMEGEKIEAARDLAVLLNEAAGDVKGIDLYIYGHTAGEYSRMCEVMVYREPGRKDRYALGSITDRCSNWDSFAIRAVMDRVRRKSSSAKKHLLFVISDGRPCNGEDKLIAEVRRQESLGVSVVGIGIEPGLKLSKFYKNSIIYTDMSTLALTIGKTVRKAVEKNSVRRRF